MSTKQLAALRQVADHPGVAELPIHFTLAKGLIRAGLITLTRDDYNYRYYQITDMGRKALETS